MRPLRLALATATLLAGCQSSTDPEPGVLCTAQVVPGLDVEVLDARSGAYIARGATATAHEGTYHETLAPGRGRGTPPADTLISLQGAGERPGTYSVVVERPGYQRWERAGVTVTRGVCHVHTVQLTARLEPAP